MNPEVLVRLAELDESICWTIDLHESLLQLDPVRHVRQALQDAHKSGKEVVKIIHGRGAGILQNNIRRLLEKDRRQQRITYFRSSDRLDEIGAVVYVVL